jgi:hypothetical protein
MRCSNSNVYSIFCTRGKTAKFPFAGEIIPKCLQVVVPHSPDYTLPEDFRECYLSRGYGSILVKDQFPVQRQGSLNPYRDMAGGIIETVYLKKF